MEPVHKERRGRGEVFFRQPFSGQIQKSFKQRDPRSSAPGRIDRKYQPTEGSRRRCQGWTFDIRNLLSCHMSSLDPFFVRCIGNCFL
jgi:hypothetical protein